MRIAHLLLVALACGVAPVASAEASLIRNGDFEAGRGGFQSDYTFVDSGLFTGLGPGDFVVRTDATSFNPLLASFGDHTTGHGLMMIVDGDWPAKTVWAETVAVTPHTLYRFSAWAASTYPTHPAALRFDADGTALGPDFQLTTATGAWIEFAADWDSGSNHAVTFAITDMNPNAYVGGDDFALDDIALTAVAAPEPGCPILLASGGVLLALRGRRAWVPRGS